MDSGFTRRTENKKKKILDAAKELFYTKGPGNSQIAEIARKANVSPASIYNYFGSKNRLIELVIREHLNHQIAKAEAVLDLDAPFKNKLERFFALGKDEKKDTDDELLKRFDWTNPVIQQTYGQFVAERQVPFLIRFIEQGKAEGAIKPDLNTGAVMAYFNANMSIYKDPDLLNKGKNYLADLSHLFFYGLLGK